MKKSAGRKTRLRKYLMAIVAAGIVVACGFRLRESGGTTAAGSARDTVSYRKDVAPVLRRFCLPCHTEDNMNPSELYLDSYDNLIKGGKHGVPVIAGKPDSSVLVLKISATPPFGDRMPVRARKAVPADTVELLRKWILQGARNN